MSSQKGKRWIIYIGSLSLTFCILVLVFSLISYQDSKKEKEYTNPEICIQLTKPGGWILHYGHRSGNIILANTNNTKVARARIEIHGEACTGSDYREEDSNQLFEYERERIIGLYHLESELSYEINGTTEIDGYVFSKYSYEIPTTALVNDQKRNQVGIYDSSAYQKVDVYLIFNDNKYIVAFVYLGEDKMINSVAEQAVLSIRFTGN
jgi:hypothetical protein